MKVAIIRGSTINKWEMQNYEPLNKNFEVEGIYAKPSFFDTSDIKFPLKNFFSPAKYIARIPNGHYLGSFLWGNFDRPFFLKKYLAKFDIINTIETFYPYTIQALDSKKKNPKQKVIVTVWENIPFNNEIFNKQKLNKERVIREADHFIAGSVRAKEALILEGANPSKISVLYMGIDLQKFQPQPKDIGLLNRLGFKKNDFIILSIGRLVWEKGIQDVVKAVRNIIYKESRVKLLIVGDGPISKQITSLSQKMKIEKNVKIIKNFPYQDIPKVHNLADIFVLPSIPVEHWQEQFGMVFIESMACAKPVISTLSGSIPEVIGDAGILVPPADSYELSKKIELLFKNKNLRIELGAKARKRALDLFNCQKVGEKISQIFQKISKS
ncbi:MAG: glycosyltransferase family 4 protein [Patescibacteria group bacterium]|nr:glycosyltransferase family 4 protein [Patescibacteria group bacterium]